MFTRRQIVALLIPLMLEQILSGLMGIADTMMVTTVGGTAISAVALVDSINTLVLYLFSALATGGVIVCTQYLGRGERVKANAAARQVVLVSTLLAVAVGVFCLIFRRPLVTLIFGSAEQAVLDQAVDYFLVTAISYPFLALQQTAAAIFRAEGRAVPPMAVAAGANMVNIAGNAILIFVFGMGVVGAAVATLVSRVVSAVLLMILLRSDKLTIAVKDYRHIRPERAVIGMVLRVGVPTGVENAMFQLGKLMVQSTVSTLGTAAIAAQAMTQTLDTVQSMPSQAVGIGLLTIVGQCMGAGRPDEARRYIRRFCLLAEGILVGMNVLVVAITPTVTRVSRMSEESAGMTFQLMVLIALAKLVLWVMSFTLPNGLRAAGDVRFTAIVSATSMWVFRVGLSMLLCRVFGVGLIGVWIGWFTDWICRAALYMWRFYSGRWTTKQVIRE